MDWLVDFGRSNERHVLLPTCDDTAWLYARHRPLLSQYFCLACSDITAIHALLHKGRLAEHARAVGLDAPASWISASASDLAKIASKLPFPVLIKPTTQALFPARSKGSVIGDAAELNSAYCALAALSHGTDILGYDASSALPMVQEFFPDASENIYNIAGFVSDGKVCGARASRKVLQRPRRLGIGVCFEEAPLDLHLTQGIERLAKRVGFNGVFEAEFVRTEDRDLLIDFNPRFYNQMAFDVARGLPLPLMAYYDALRRESAAFPACSDLPRDEPAGKVFVYGAAFKVLVTSQQLSGALKVDEAEAWLRWFNGSGREQVDAVEDPDDVWPGRIDTAMMVHHHLRHPRSFWRSIVMNR